MNNPAPGTPSIFAGISGIKVTSDQIELGHGVILKPTYAHFFAANMLAYSPPTPKGHHGGPWKSANSGFGFDITAELEIPLLKELQPTFEQKDIAILIAGLIRMLAHPHLSLRVISDISFDDVKSKNLDPKIIPVETKYRIFHMGEKADNTLTEESINWINEKWYEIALLMIKHGKLLTAFNAFDESSVHGHVSSSLLMIWGAIEQLFSSNNSELKFRVCANLAAYLEEFGEKRYKLFQELSDIYNARSVAAHTSKQLEYGPLLSSYVYLRNALIKIFDTGIVPDKNALEKLVFAGPD